MNGLIQRHGILGIFSDQCSHARVDNDAVDRGQRFVHEVAEDGGLALQLAEQALGHVDLADGDAVGAARVAAHGAHECASDKDFTKAAVSAKVSAVNAQRRVDGY